MKNTNEILKEKVATKLGNTLINVGEASTRGCLIFGSYEPKVSVELLKSMMK